MKKILGASAAIAFLTMGSFYGMGFMTEKAVRQNIQSLNATSNGLSVEIDEYHRGWFQADAKLTWRLHVPERVVVNDNGQSEVAPAEDFQMTIPLNIAHGPIIVANHTVRFGLGYAYTDLTLPNQFEEQFKQAFTDKSVAPEVSVSLFVNFLNRTKLDLDMPTFKLISKQNGAELDWNGIESQVSVSSNLRHYEGHVEMKGFKFTQDKSNAVLGPISSDYQVERTEQGLYLGKAQVSMPSFVIMQDSQKTFEVLGLDIESGSAINEGLFSSFFLSKLEKVFVYGETYGPGKFKASLRNLDAEVLGRINQDSAKLQEGTDEERQKVLFALLPELPKLFTKGAELSIDELKFVVPSGTIDGNLLVAMPAGKLDNPLMFMQKLKGHGELSVPAGVFEKLLKETAKQRVLQQTFMEQVNAADTATPPTASSNEPAATDATAQSTESPALTAEQLDVKATTLRDEMLKKMLESGAVVKHADKYAIVLDLHDGQLMVNDKPFNAAMLNVL